MSLRAADYFRWGRIFSFLF